MRRRLAYGLAVLLSVASLGAGAAGGPNSSEAGSTQQIPRASNAAWVVVQPGRKHRIKPYQVGLASWYGKYFDGKPTASGEPYDMHDLTAAHPTLPLGTFVKVTNLRNGRSIVVRVNDRGPVVDGRIIDLSYNAAKAIEMRGRGVQRVRLDLVPTQIVAMSAQTTSLP
jgi:peptidoglycan lytic transglycosylase